jgi:uncharacterized protein
MYFLLYYDYVENIIEKRVPFREAHLGLVGEYVERGEIILAGAYANPVDGAVLVFKVGSQAKIEEFMKEDPYVNNGLVIGCQIREWTVVAGSK